MYSKGNFETEISSGIYVSTKFDCLINKEENWYLEVNYLAVNYEFVKELSS